MIPSGITMIGTDEDIDEIIRRAHDGDPIARLLLNGAEVSPGGPREIPPDTPPMGIVEKYCAGCDYWDGEQCNSPAGAPCHPERDR